MTDKKASNYAGLNGFFGIWRNAQERYLFSDTKPPENFAQQVVGAEFTGNRRERQLRQPQFFGEQFELRETFVTRAGLDRLRKVDDILHRRLAHIPEIWQAPAISLPLFDAEGNQAFVLRPVCSQDAMTADVYPIAFDLLAELARAIRAVPGAGHLFYDITTKPPGTIEWE